MTERTGREQLANPGGGHEGHEGMAKKAQR